MRFVIAACLVLMAGVCGARAEPDDAERLYLTAREALDDESNPPEKCVDQPWRACMRIAREVETPEGKRWRREWAIFVTVVTETPLVVESEQK